MNDKDLLFGQIKDKYYQCQGKNILTATDFLDLSQQSQAHEFLDKEFAGAGLFFGGYGEAERRKIIFLPDYLEGKTTDELIDLLDEQDLIKAIKITRPKEGKPLGHRDYLGSLMGEGIKREKIGDILVEEKGAHILVAGEVAQYLMDNYSMAGRVSISLSMESLRQVESIRPSTKEIKDTVASLRLDSVLSSAFGISRSKASEAIKMGIVFVNSVEATKTDSQVKEGDKLVIRGKGKAVLKEVQGKTKKDRFFVLIERYV